MASLSKLAANTQGVVPTWWRRLSLFMRQLFGNLQSDETTADHEQRATSQRGKLAQTYLTQQTQHGGNQAAACGCTAARLASPISID